MVPSEAVLQGGQHATFRLVVRVTTEDGRPLPVRPAVSEKFHVSARRSRPAKQCGVSALRAVRASAHQNSRTASAIGTRHRQGADSSQQGGCGPLHGARS